MRQETLGRRTLVTSTVAVTSLRATWMLVHAIETPQGSAEDDIKENVGEQEPFDALGVGGGAATPVSADISDEQENLDAEALVLVTEAPTAAPITARAVTNEGEKVASAQKEKEPTLNLDYANLNEENDAPAPAQTTEVLIAEVPTTEAPTNLLPQTTEPVVIVDTTTKPYLRTQDPAVISDAVTNGAAEAQAPGYLNQGSNPLVLVALVGFCCIFLLLWWRKRRSRSPSSSGSSGNTTSKGPQVQYTQVPDEQPFSHRQDDDDEYCDDYEEDTFANDRDNWDDWEGNSTQTQVSQLNPFIAAPSVPRPTSPRQGSLAPIKLTLPLPPPPQQQQHVELQEMTIADQVDLLPSSVESNSSSDSFEVVTAEAHAPPTSTRGATADAEKEGESVDDLFSQFGMVPTFKKSAVVPPLPVAISAAPISQSGTVATPSSSSSMPTAAEASALFAAEMDDELTAVDEWGEDDEWVKGI